MANATLRIAMKRIVFLIMASPQIHSFLTLRPRKIRLTMPRVNMMAVNIDVRMPSDRVTAKPLRSEERRVGKDGRVRRGSDLYQKGVYNTQILQSSMDTQ